MFAILRALDPQLYTPRTYVLAATDTTSASKVERFESEVVEGRDGWAGTAAPRIGDQGRTDERTDSGAWRGGTGGGAPTLMEKRHGFPCSDSCEVGGDQEQ